MLGMQSEAHCNAHSLLLARDLASHARAIDIYESYGGRSGGGIIFGTLTPYQDTVRSLLSGKSFLLTHCPQIYIRKEISRPGFLDVSR
jgi:hypothetical protein